MKIANRSQLTGKTHVMDLPVTHEQIERWQNGALIQNVFPHLTDAQREFLMTGCTEEEWDEAFPDDEDDFVDDEPAF